MNRAQRRDMKKRRNKVFKKLASKVYGPNTPTAKISEATPCNCMCGCREPWREPPADPDKKTPFYWCCTDCWDEWMKDKAGLHGV